jgi:hypothetical protein
MNDMEITQTKYNASCDQLFSFRHMPGRITSIMPGPREDSVRSHIKSCIQDWLRTGAVFLIFLARYGFRRLYDDDDDTDMEGEMPERE